MLDDAEVCLQSERAVLTTIQVGVFMSHFRMLPRLSAVVLGLAAAFAVTSQTSLAQEAQKPNILAIWGTISARGTSATTTVA